VTKEKLKIGIIAAEHSGDRLGAKLISALQDFYDVELFGLGGPAVNALSISTPSDIDYQDLQVMGIIDPLINLPKLLKIRKRILNLFLANGINLFIGVDSPDFNMFFHKKLKRSSVKTIQVVSPSVWAWRENRIKAIHTNIDLTLCLFRFEHQFYQQKNMNSFFLGHPFSSLQANDRNQIIAKHQLSDSKNYISILPGSRKSEISCMMPIFLKAAKKITSIDSNSTFLIPAANKELAQMIRSFKGLKEIDYKLATNTANDFLSVSKISIVTSGTASLEAAVLGSLPIICYKTNAINYAILSRMIKTPFIGLPNLLLQKHLFPELIQGDLSVNAIIENYLKLRDDSEHYHSSVSEINEAMQGQGFEAAAQAIQSLG
jgi:lipid-A-disaccharide synthase